MFAYIIRRVWQMIPTLLGVMLLVFVLFNLFGGDPTIRMAGKGINKEKIAQIKSQLGLDQSYPVQFAKFAQQVVTFDYGRSWSTNEPVSKILKREIPVSLTLMLQVWIYEAIIAVIIGMAVAYRRGTLTDRAIMMICTAAMSISFLLYIVVGQYVFSSVLGWFQPLGWSSDDFWLNIRKYAPLPVMLTLMVSVTPALRLYRSFIVEETTHDYVRTARAKGASESRVMFVHVLRNAAVPIITNMALELPSLFVSAFLVEFVFSIPGVGREIIAAGINSDFPVIKAIAVYTAILTMVVNLVVDLLYKWLDPRVELK
jgi:peptide/nickel transport system permease protein